MYAFFISALVALGSSRSTWRAFTMGAPSVVADMVDPCNQVLGHLARVAVPRGGGSRAPEQMRASGARGARIRAIGSKRKLYLSVRTHGLVHA